MGGTTDGTARFAFVGGARRREEVAAYLPSNYGVLGTGSHTGLHVVVISGFDHHGWTLDDYVRPRLMSGGMGCDEIDLAQAADIVSGNTGRDGVRTFMDARFDVTDLNDDERASLAGHVQAQAEAADYDGEGHGYPDVPVEVEWNEVEIDPNEWPLNCTDGSCGICPRCRG